MTLETVNDGRTRVRTIASARTWLESNAVDQLRKTANLPGMRLAVGLPDLHAGKNAPIGAAFVTTGCAYPTLVGSDIGCGVALYRTGLDARRARKSAWPGRLQGLDNPWDGPVADFLHARGVEPTEFDRALGTIGGGNHFAELQSIESISNAELAAAAGVDAASVYLCVHSGSRGFGQAVLSGHSSFEQYLAGHDHAVAWARANRELIAQRILECLDTTAAPIADVTHNWVERIEYEGEAAWLHRKGAAPSDRGLVMIPGSRGTFSYLVMPKDPTDASAWSLAHGAGRKWSRTDSRGKLKSRHTVKDLERTDLGSTVICEDRDLLYEEAPQAYKNITSVIGDLVDAGLMEVVATLRPMLTYKVRR